MAPTKKRYTDSAAHSDATDTAEEMSTQGSFHIYV